MWDFFLFISFVFFGIVWMVFNVLSKPKDGKQPPIIFPMLPIVGNSFQFLWNRNRLLQYGEDVMNNLGTTFQFVLPHLGSSIIAAEPECAEYILKTNFENYPKGPNVHEILRDLLGEGIFTTDGEHWKSQRKTFSHLFKMTLMKSLMFNTFIEHGELVLKKLEEYSRSKEVVDIMDIFYKYTLDSIGKIAFGKNINSLESETPVSRAFDTALRQTEKRVSSPLWKLLPDPSLKKSIQILDDYAYKLIIERRQDPDVMNKEDLLSRYIANTTENDRYLRDVIMNFLIAGRDTTGQTLTWLFYLLSQNPIVEKELIQRIDKTFHGKLPTFEELKSFDYLEGVINETLRLYPPVPVDPKYSLNDDILPNGFFIKKGSNVAWSAWLMGRNEKYWDQPLEFKPERWTPELKKNIHPYLFIPFQAGPRQCLGMTMALLEAKILSVLILQKFHLRFLKNHPVEPIFNITLTSRYGMKMTIEKRHVFY